MFIIYIGLCIFSFFYFGWNFITRSNPKTSISYEPYIKFDNKNFSLDVPCSYAYTKNINKDKCADFCKYKYYDYKSSFKNEPLCYECDNFNNRKKYLTNKDNSFELYNFCDANNIIEKNKTIYEEFKISNLFKFNYTYPDKFPLSDNYYYNGTNSDVFRIELEFAHNILIIRDNILFENIESYKEFISVLNIVKNPKANIYNYKYVIVIKLSYETLILFICRFIPMINLYFTIFQSIYFFLAKYYYKKYLISILTERIDLKKALSSNELQDKDIITNSFTFKSYIFSLICLSRYKKNNRRLIIYESLSTQLDEIIEMKNILILNNNILS